MKIDFIEEPELEFGTGRHIDIRYGLANYGPLDFANPLSPRQINTGVVGTPETVERLLEWLEKCRNGIPAKESSQPNLFPHFPGFRLDNNLNTTLVLDSQLQRTILDREFDKLKPLSGTDLAVERSVELFRSEIQILTERTKPHVVLCAVPMQLIKQNRLIKHDPAIAEQHSDGAEENRFTLDFHHLLKAKAMDLGVPIQIVLPMTYDPSKRLSQKRSTIMLKTMQDEATRAWNLHVALYYKAGGTPWRLVRDPRALTTCYVGVSFYESLDKTRLLTSLAQVFNERGDGVVVRGGAAQLAKDDRQPHLAEQGAHDLLASALDAYEREHRTTPARLVLHKSSLFDENECSGFAKVLKARRIYSADFLTLHQSDAKLFRTSFYPSLRGTLLTLDDESLALYTRGSVDFFSTYPGLYAPQALGVRLQATEQTALFLAEEILALTKMNWNNTQFDGFEPIDLRGSRQVGRILKYVPEGKRIQPRYSYYM
ncbi:MAG: hypothetical protein LAO04_06645 [Acidobacteriia bacterium]|nr:hypothetical protein [Terriglobia bacterium]